MKLFLTTCIVCITSKMFSKVHAYYRLINVEKLFACHTMKIKLEVPAERIASR